MNITNIINSVKILKKNYLCGPNMWNYKPSLEVLIDIGEFENYPSNKIPNFYENLKKTLPTLEYHRCNLGIHGGFFERVKEGTYFGHILEHVTLELQNYTGLIGGMGRTRETENNGVYKIVLRALCANPSVIKECFDCALDLLFLLVQNKKVDLKIYIKRILSISYKCYGLNTYEIIKYIPDTIPYFKIDESNNFIQLGYGKKQQRLWTSETSYTKGIPETISKNKDFTKMLLKNQGIPVPQGYIANNLKDAYKHAEKIGYPITIKPLNGNGGRGVTTNIKNKKDVSNSYLKAKKNNKQNETSVIVEEFIEGDTYRITIVNNKVVGCAKWYMKIIKDVLVGDGISTIQDLIDDLNAKYMLEYSHKELPSKSEELFIQHNHFYKTYYTEEYLEKKGYNLQSILSNNKKIELERKYDAYIQCLDLLNETTKNICLLATKIVGIDICGIDLVIDDISKKLNNNNGAIIELNAGASIGLHMNQKPHIGLEVIKYLFNNDLSVNNSCIPIISIIGDGNAPFVNSFISSFFISIEKNVGSYGKNGLYLNNIAKNNEGNKYNWESVKQVLMNKKLEIAIFDTDSNIICNEGLFYKECNSIILGKIQEVKYNSECVENEPNNVLKILRIHVDIISKNGYSVLNMDDENINKLVELCDGNIIFYTIKENDNIDLNNFNNTLFEQYENIEKKNNNNSKMTINKKVCIENDNIILYDNYQKTILCQINQLTETLKYISKSDLLATIGGIWSYYDLHSNSKIFQKFINKI